MIQQFRNSPTFPAFTVNIGMPCSREEGCCLQHACELRFVEEYGLLDSGVGVEIDGENGARDRREIGIHRGFHDGKVFGVESRDDATVGGIAM